MQQTYRKVCKGHCYYVQHVRLWLRTSRHSFTAYHLNGKGGKNQQHL